MHVAGAKAPGDRAGSRENRPKKDDEDAQEEQDSK